MILRYLPLADSMARSHRGRGVDLDELKAEAYLGLCLASQAYDPIAHGGASFGTYARTKIYSRLRKAIDGASIVRRDVRSERAGRKVTRCGIAVEHMAMFDQLPDLDPPRAA
jgi:DNA-directed RNA polymerase specialized sigma subunit